MKATTGVLWKWDDGTVEWENYDNTDEMYYDLARHYAWRDCDDSVEVVAIVDHNELVQYCGWEPDMVFRFRSITSGKDTYECQHMEWEH